MALQAKYTQYLARPNADALATNASIHYVPTLSTINEPVAILRHLSAQDQQLNKKSEKFLNVLETSNNLCIEAETTIEFVAGGGTYLPGLDDNFLADKTVTVVIVHVVAFNSEQKIQQIRLHWDQGSLLKSIEVIGRTGRNWPLFDGKDQARLITTSVAAMPQTSMSQSEQQLPRRQSRAGQNGDPHTTLDQLFSPRTTLTRGDSEKNLVAPRESSKPAAREYGELFAAGGEPTAGDRSPSPTKTSQMKYGAGKNHQNNRLFDHEAKSATADKTSIKTNPAKFNHFEFGDATPMKPAATKANMNASQWDFADFVTPHKTIVRTQSHTQRHFGMGEDQGEVADSSNTDVRMAVKPRPDAKTHFEINDDTPKTFERNSTAHTRGMEPFPDHIVDNHVTSREEPTGNVLGNITNLNSHNRTFDSHWDMSEKGSIKKNVNSKTVPEGMKQGVKPIQPTWANWDDSPQQKQGRIKIAGNGIGGRTGTSSLWDY